MKKYIFMMVAALGLASCSEDYLENTPNDAISTTTAFATTENVALAVNGISKMMTTQYLGVQGMNGEGTMKNWYNNFNGNDTQKCNQTGWSSLWNNLASYKTSQTSTYSVYPWYYYYKLIGNANTVIARAQEAAGPQEEKDFYQAQALVYRAYSYLQLLSMYSTRWCDSNNGSANGVILRLEETDPSNDLDKGLSTMAECYGQIYADLDQAISLFQGSGMTRDGFYLPDLSVAYAVYARAALYREDWANADKYAALARNGYSLMSVSDYKAGFSEENNEWIWGVYEAEDQTLYYYSYFAYIGSNASASVCRNYPVAISKELIDQIPVTDVRRDLYLVPESDEEFATMNAAGRATKGAMFNRAKANGYLYSTSYVYGYQQYKFRVAFLPGGGSFHLFRAAEMYYIQAEADCHLGNDAEAQTLLYEVTKQYDDSLETITETGDALLEKVKLYRRFDLFGEGFDWSDCKRWKKDIVRKKLNVADGLASEGSFHSTFAITIPADDDSRWIWAIPKKETDYNHAFDLKE
jgi:hypothetical protein